MAVIGVPAMLAPVFGPVLGGLIVSDASWRLLFYINLPICLLALLASLPRHDAGHEAGRRFPARPAGLSLLSPALAAVVFGLAQAGSYGSFSDNHVLIPIAVGIVLLLGFVLHALRTRTEPIIDLRLFRARSFSGSSAVVFLFSMAMLGTTLLLPLYYQQVRGENALHAGLLLAPHKDSAWESRSSSPAGSPTSSAPTNHPRRARAHRAPAPSPTPSSPPTPAPS